MHSAAEIAKEVSTADLKLYGPLQVDEVHDAGSKDLNNGEVDTEDMVIMAEVSIAYSGNPPESNRVLNAVVLDWVSANAAAVEEEIRGPVLDYLEKDYPEMDSSDFEGEDAVLVWPDQVDYLASVDEKAKRIHFSIEINPEIEEV